MKVRLPAAGAPWLRLRAAQIQRADALLLAVPSGALPRHTAARRFWSQRTWSELAAVPAVSQVVLALVREGSSLDVMGAFTAIASDEVRHAQLSQQVAERLGGYVDEVPDGLDYAPRRLAAPSDVPVVVWALANGCYSETVSLELIRARHAVTTHPVVRAVLAATLRDEAVHVRIGWQLAESLLPLLSRTARRDLKRYGVELAELLRRTFGTVGLPAGLRARQRRLRDETASGGLGSLEADAENAVVQQSLHRIEARLEGLWRR